MKFLIQIEFLVARESLTLQLNKPKPSNKIYDSGFLESERAIKNEQSMEINQLMGLSFDISPSEIQRLIAECNAK